MHEVLKPHEHGLKREVILNSPLHAEVQVASCT